MNRISRSTMLTLSAIGAFGIALMVYIMPRAHPAAAWRVQCDREMAQVKAREISSALGVDTAGWDAVVTGGSGKDVQVKVNKGQSAGTSVEITPDSASRFSEVFPKVALAAPHGSERVIAKLSADGHVNSWELKGYQKLQRVDETAARKLAAAALKRITGVDEAAFRPVPGPAENEGTLSIAFERAQPPQRFEAVVNGARLVRAELKSTAHDAGDDRRTGKKVITWLKAAASVAISFLGTVLAAIVYVFWAVRRGIRHRFVLAFSATGIIWGAVYWVNWMGYDERFNTISTHESLAENFAGGAFIVVFIVLFYIVLMGAADAIGQPDKMAALRSVFTSSALNRRAGLSIFAGLVCAPVVAVIPTGISGLHLFGAGTTREFDAVLIYSAHPGLQSMDVLASALLIGVFGFGAAQLSRFIRKAWLSTLILAVCGSLLMAAKWSLTDTGAVEFLLTGVLLFLVYQQLFLRFDLLAILTTAWCAEALWNASALVLQPAPTLHSSGVAAFATLAVFAGCAGLAALRGKPLAIDERAAPAAVTSQRESLMKEFSIAHRVQQEMLPERPPEIPGCTLAASCQPAQEVGGDLFDFLQLPDGRWTIGVGDVSGKGVPAALYMTLTKGLLIATTQDSSDLADIIANVNRHVHAATERKTFVTMALGAFDPETRTFDHVRAGHNPIVWRRVSDDATLLLNAPGLGLGIVSDRLFRRSIQPQRLQLGSGDALVFYSDGITEAMNSHREQFGEERLMRSIEQADGMDAGGVRERIVANVRDFLAGISPQDDMTVVVLRVH